MRIAMPVRPASCEICTVAPSDALVVQPLGCSKSSRTVTCAMESWLSIINPNRNEAIASVRGRASNTPLVLQCPAHDPRDVISLQPHEPSQHPQHGEHPIRN